VRLISHRGNINGPLPERENSPNYIEEAISLGYDVEVDLWFEGGSFYLGHDKPQYEIRFEWLEQWYYRLWVHCKNIHAVQYLKDFNYIHYFWHQEDDIALTSFNFLWTYPGKELWGSSICVLPELNNEEIPNNIHGICSDFIKKYKKI